MAIVTAGSGSLLMNNLDVNYEGTIYPGATNVRVTGRGGVYTDFGGEFAYRPGGGFTGLVTSIVHVVGGQPAFTVTDILADAETLFAYLKSGDIRGAEAYVLKGDDQITGSDEHDVLLGWDGDDSLSGMGARDVLIGGYGADELTGGRGRDVFRYRDVDESTVALHGRDTITDFRSGIDTIDLSRIDADLRTRGDGTFTFVDDFTRESGQLRVVSDGTGFLVEGDTDGNGQADFAILVQSTSAPVATDFIL